MSPEVYQIMARLMVLAGIVPSVIFIILYTLNYSWWRNRMGRHLFSLTASIAAALSVTLYNAVVGPYTAEPYITIGMFAAIAVVMWRQVMILVATLLDDFGRDDE